MRARQTILAGCGVIALALAGASVTQADDLASVSGNWATSAQACSRWKSGSFKSTAEESGQIMSIVGNSISWTRGGCMMADVQVAGGAITAKTQCERRGNTATGTIKITVSSKTRIVVDAGGSGYSGTYVKCDCRPKSADEFLGCH